MAATQRLRKLLELAHELEPKERVELADELLRSIAANDEDDEDEPGDDAAASLHPEWKQELEQRISDIESGRAELVSSAEANELVREAIASARQRR